jgi:Winged helix DNA-binding domain
LIFPSDDLVLPSLWEAVAGTSDVTWSSRDDEGHFLDFSPEFGQVWRWKDELPERRLACVGKHVRGRSAIVSLDVLPSLVAARGEPEAPSALERAIIELLEDQGPCSTADLPGLIGYERRPLAAAVDRLQRRLVLTAAGAQERPQGWPAVVVDLLGRRYGVQLGRLPDVEDARAQLAGVVLRSVGELSAADLAAIVGSTRKQASAALDRLAEDGLARRQQEEEGFALYRRSRRHAR